MMNRGAREILESGRQDRVFQVSLTEIAFIIAFLVIFLLGWIVVRAEAEKTDALARAETAGDAQAVVAVADKMRADLETHFGKSGVVDPGVVVSELVAREKLARERDALRSRVDQLEQAVSTLVEAKASDATTAADARPRQIAEAMAVASVFRRHPKERPASAEGQGRTDTTSGREDMVTTAKSALALKTAVDRELHGALGRKVTHGQEAQVAAELVSAVRTLSAGEGSASAQAYARENRDLRGQVAFLKGKLEGRGGRDYPPCWAEEGSGRIQYLFAIDITEQGLLVRPAWPEARKADAAALPGIDGLPAPQTALPLRAFKSWMQGIDELSRKRNCRHYVVMRNHVRDLTVFNNYRFAIEHSFYKLEPQS